MPKVELVLGAAQLGMEYGVANRMGRLSAEDAMTFLDYVTDRGVSAIDTSPLYGDSETLIGRFVEHSGTPLKVTTKLPPLELAEGDSDAAIIERVSASLGASLARLRVPHVENYLVHSEPDFLAYGERLISALGACRDQGLVRRIGVSVYTPAAALQAIDAGVDCLQLPCNLFDRRFEQAGVFTLAATAGVHVFARSLYLQGLFHLEPDALAGWLPDAVEPMKALHRLAQTSGRSIAEIAFVYVRDHAGVHSLVVGMESGEQLDANLELMRSEPLPEALSQIIRRDFSDIPERVVNPSLWRRA